jgi:hypothetical protein
MLSQHKGPTLEHLEIHFARPRTSPIPHLSREAINFRKRRGHLPVEARLEGDNRRVLVRF